MGDVSVEQKLESPVEIRQSLHNAYLFSVSFCRSVSSALLIIVTCACLHRVIPCFGKFAAGNLSL